MSNDPRYDAVLAPATDTTIIVDLSHTNGSDHLKIEVALRVIGNTVIEYAILTPFNKAEYDEHVAEILWAIREAGFEREFN